MMEQQHRMIRLLLNTFGILGVQLRPLQWNNVLSILNWSLNNLIIVATLYLLNDQKPFHSRLASLISSDQYLMYYYVKICAKIIFPIICLFYVITYWIYGHRLISQLQSSRFASIKIPKRVENIVIIVAFVIPMFFLCLRNYLPFDSFNLQTLFAIEIFTFYRSVTWILLYFNQLANLRVLEQIRQRYLHDDIEKQLANGRKCQSLCLRRQSRCISSISASLEKIGKRNDPIRHTLKNQSSITKCRDLFEEMKDLAELNNRLQPMFSILTTLHLVHTSAVVTILLNDIAMADFPYNLGYFVEILFRISVWFGLLTLNRKVLQNFDQIEGFMLRKLRKVHPNQTLPSTTNLSPLKCSKVLKFKEMNIYQQSFYLLLFDVMRIDLKFLLDWICFIASYATLIHQTRWL
ncbi:uncharacterized protein LOC124491949 [Dermatophagoides farinae]|uniref:uncharacterized protein LOC124491949 n=1 Tax=Dermatophagoides farinae TaxID=6954 RepID=UPI003F6125AF